MKFEDRFKEEFDKIKSSDGQKNKLKENIRIRLLEEHSDAALLYANRFKEEFNKIQASDRQKSKLIENIKIGLDKSERSSATVFSVANKQKQESEHTDKIKKSWFFRNIKWLASSFAAVVVLAVMIPVIVSLVGDQHNNNITIVQYAEALGDIAGTLKEQSKEQTVSKSGVSKFKLPQYSVQQVDAPQPYMIDEDIIDLVSIDEILDEIIQSAPIAFGIFSFEFCKFVLQSPKFVIPSPKTDFYGKMSEPILMEIDLGKYSSGWNCAIELAFNGKEMTGILACYSSDSVVMFSFKAIYNFETKLLTECEWTAMFSFQSTNTSNYMFLYAKYKNSNNINSFEYNSEVSEAIKTQNIKKFNEFKNAEKLSFQRNMQVELEYALQFLIS